jgi:uncharacterized protein (TIGR02246 family)
MRKRRLLVLLLLAVTAGFVAGPGVGQQSKGDLSDKEAIAKNAEAFLEAFHKGDAAAVASFFTEDSEFTGLTGVRLKGRATIEKALQKFFEENKGQKVQVQSESLHFVTPEVAIEDGLTLALHPDGMPPSRARYTMVHVKKEGKWYIGSMRNSAYVPPTNYEHLRDVEWAVGNWSGGSDKGNEQHLSLAWTDGENFITGTFTASVNGVSVGQATHWVGWDPRSKRIRSWIFDATGGFGEADWTKEGDGWVIKTNSVQQDGKPMTMTIHLGRVDADTIRLHTTDRTIDGKAAPDAPEFRLKRVK